MRMKKEVEAVTMMICYVSHAMLMMMCHVGHLKVRHRLMKMLKVKPAVGVHMWGRHRYDRRKLRLTGIIRRTGRTDPGVPTVFARWTAKCQDRD